MILPELDNLQNFPDERVMVVTGSRRITSREIVGWCLERFRRHFELTLLVHGDAAGVDRLARDWARARGVGEKGFPPDYAAYPANIRRWAAPKARNTSIIEMAHASRGDLGRRIKRNKRRVRKSPRAPNPDGDL